MMIVILQSKLLQHADLWVWHTSYESTATAFHKDAGVVIWRLV